VLNCKFLGFLIVKRRERREEGKGTGKEMARVLL